MQESLSAAKSEIPAYSEPWAAEQHAWQATAVAQLKSMYAPRLDGFSFDDAARTPVVARFNMSRVRDLDTRLKTQMERCVKRFGLDGEKAEALRALCTDWTFNEGCKLTHLRHETWKAAGQPVWDSRGKPSTGTELILDIYANACAVELLARIKALGISEDENCFKLAGLAIGKALTANPLQQHAYIRPRKPTKHSHVTTEQWFAQVLNFAPSQPLVG